MRRHRPLRLFTCAVLAGSASLAVVLPGSIASAKTKPVKEVCASISGSSTTQTLSGCTGDPALTSGVSDVATSTVTWNNGNTSTESYTYAEKTGKADKCAPVAGDTPVAEVKETGKVTGGTQIDLVGGKIKGTVCVYSNPVAGIVIVGHGPQDL